MTEKEVGKVIHYYDKAMVAVVRLTDDIKVGDTAKVVKGDTEFEFKIESIQLNHEPLEKGESGQEIAIKVPNPAKEGAIVYKVESE